MVPSPSNNTTTPRSLLWDRRRKPRRRRPGVATLPTLVVTAFAAVGKVVRVTATKGAGVTKLRLKLTKTLAGQRSWRRPSFGRAETSKEIKVKLRVA